MSDVLDQQPASGRDQDLQAALRAAGLPIDDLEQSGRTFFRFADRAQIIGFAGLEPYGDYALLRSVVALPDQRRRGYGEAISRQMLDQAARDGAPTLYLLTETATAFFDYFGLREDRSHKRAGRNLANRPGGKPFPGLCRPVCQDYPRVKSCPRLNAI